MPEPSSAITRPLLLLSGRQVRPCAFVVKPAGGRFHPADVVPDYAGAAPSALSSPGSDWGARARTRRRWSQLSKIRLEPHVDLPRPEVGDRQHSEAFA